MMPATTLSNAEVLQALREAVSASGSQRTYATRIGVSQAYLGDVLHGRRSPGERVLSALGLKRIVIITNENRNSPRMAGTRVNFSISKPLNGAMKATMTFAM